MSEPEWNRFWIEVLTVLAVSWWAWTLGGELFGSDDSGVDDDREV